MSYPPAQGGEWAEAQIHSCAQCAPCEVTGVQKEPFGMPWWKGLLCTGLVPVRGKVKPQGCAKHGGQWGPQGTNLPVRQCQSKAVAQTCPPFYLSHPQTPDAFSLAFSSADRQGANNITQKLYFLEATVSSCKRGYILMFPYSYVKKYISYQ